MASSLLNLGSSLEVPIVQELAKKRLSTVPTRYIRPDDDPLAVFNASSLPQIPTIDMDKLFDAASMASEQEKLHNACQEWGFFMLTNHGVDSDVMEKIKSAIQEFFNLPMEEKSEFRQVAGDVEGYGQAFVVSEEQKLDWADMFYLVTLPADLRKPHLIPKLPPAIRDAIEAYSAELKTLGLKILTQIALALGMQTEEIEALFKQGLQSMRTNYYPPCPQPELVTGLCAHSDPVGLTILLQVNEMHGLQIKKDGVWIPVSPLPHAFVVNIGDIMEIVTNGAYQSIEHRAVVNSEKERLSIATFLFPNLEVEFGPAPSLVCPETPARFKRITVTEFLRSALARELKGKSYIESMRI